jgi:hypothetical protein
LLAGKKDERIPLEEVPEKALAAAKAAVEGIVLTEAEIEKVKKDLVVYELEGVAAGVKYEIEVTSEGKVIEVEEDDDEDEEDHDDDDHEAETGNEHDDDESDDD